jgi:hypothetical protein
MFSPYSHKKPVGELNSHPLTHPQDFNIPSLYSAQEKHSKKTGHDELIAMPRKSFLLCRPD